MSYDDDSVLHPPSTVEARLSLLFSKNTTERLLDFSHRKSAINTALRGFSENFHIDDDDDDGGSMLK